MKTRTCLQALFCFVLVARVSCALQSNRTRADAGPAATPADPTIKLQGLDGHFYDIADMHGSVVLMSFGATWCAPCSRELAALEELKREYADKPVKFFWVSIDNPGEASDGKLKAYAKEHKLTIPVLRDPTRTTFLQFSPRVRLPLVVFFGKDGRADGPGHFGMSSEPEIYKKNVRDLLDKLLATPRSEGE